MLFGEMEFGEIIVIWGVEGKGPPPSIINF